MSFYMFYGCWIFVFVQRNFPTQYAAGQFSTAKLSIKELFDKDQIGIKEPFLAKKIIFITDFVTLCFSMYHYHLQVQANSKKIAQKKRCYFQYLWEKRDYSMTFFF